VRGVSLSVLLAKYYSVGRSTGKDETDENVARMREKRNANRVLVVKPEGK
jgi:hypothetical protein